jgi:tetratricopeptide (TPR) repeat protein
VLVNEGRFEEGIVYFRRAIYGQWKEDPAGNRRRVRFELIDLLAQRDSKEELLAELLPMQDQATQDSRTRTRLGRLFLQAGSPARAADVFREILHDTPGDAGAHAGLGEAEFDRGDYRAAQRDFHAALRLAPGDQATRQRLDLCDDLLTLDPMLRGLSPRERFWRSTRLLDLSREEASRCVGGNPSLELQELLDKAEKARKSRVSVARQSEALESNLDLAEQLWQAAKKQCKPAPAGDSPLTLVLARLAQ